MRIGQQQRLKSIMNTAFSPKNKIILLEIDDVEVLASLCPDYTALINSDQGINGVLVTAPADGKEYDYHYRYFWPWSGTNEDPVTGGVQTFLAKYWAERLNKTIMKSFQSSARTGYMNIELPGDRVLLISEAVIIVEGDLLVVN